MILSLNGLQVQALFLNSALMDLLLLQNTVAKADYFIILLFQSVNKNPYESIGEKKS